MTDWASWWCRLLGYSSCYSLSTEETFIVVGAGILVATLATLMIFNLLLKLLER